MICEVYGLGSGTGTGKFMDISRNILVVPYLQHPLGHTVSTKYPKISNSSAKLSGSPLLHALFSTVCGCGGRGGHGRGGHGGNHNNRGNIINGVDICDPTRYFPREEWSKLDNATHKRILDSPDMIKKKNLMTGSNVSAIVTVNEEVQHCLVASINNCVMIASAQNVAPPESVQIPSRHGRVPAAPGY